MVEITISPNVESKLRDIYRDKLYDKLRKEISQYVGKTATQKANPILKQFLAHHFLVKDEVSEKRIAMYLFRKDPEQIIRTFWAIVAFQWISKLNINPMQLSYYSRKLCEIHSINRFDLPEKQRKTYNVKDAIPYEKEMALFIDVYTVTDPKGKVKRKVKFKYHDELYAAKTGALTVLGEIFDYDTKLKYTIKNRTLRHIIMSKMAISACPYCNRQYTTNYGPKDGEKATADLDHFYCKTRYPFLALSIYNFVPSCQLCNSRFKGDIDFYIHPHVNPHKRGFGSDAVFVLKDPKLLLDDNAWKNHGELVVQLDVGGPDAAMIKRSIQTFHLNEVYESHTDYVREIIWKSKAYSPEMIQCVRDEFGSLFHSEDEIKELIFGQYLNETDASKRPLAKLAQDLLGKAEEWNWPATSPLSTDDS